MSLFMTTGQLIRTLVDCESRLALFVGELAAGVEAVEIQDGIEHERIGATSFTAVDRVDGEENDVAAARRHVDNSGVLGDFIATFDETGDEQFFAIGVAENDAGAI